MLSILRGSQARIIVQSKDISPWMKHAIVAVEDKRFYEHRGVDLRGMARAVWADVSHRGTVVTVPLEGSVKAGSSVLVTVERDGGVAAPTQQPILSVRS